MIYSSIKKIGEIFKNKYSNKNTLEIINRNIEKEQNKINSIDNKIDLIIKDIEFIKNTASSYLGGGTALTYLDDETPIFVNSNDYGGPINIINGGKYEPENLEVLQSFVKPNSIILDIGANLGYFSLKLAQQIRSRGKIYSFEPHPFVSELLCRSVFLNSLNSDIVVHRFGLSDRNGNANFAYPQGHVGGGGIVGDAAGSIRLEIKVADEIFPPDFIANIVKIDVEGHEYSVLRGMQGIIERSSDIVILFEKLGINAGNENDLASLFEEMGMDLYAVMPNSNLESIGAEKLSSFSGYVLANKKNNKIELIRSKFQIYPPQLRILANSKPNNLTSTTHISRKDPGVLFHGPYWYLRRGKWRLTFIGKIKGIILIRITERCGQTVQSFPLQGENAVTDFVINHDLIHFEVVAEDAVGGAEVELGNIVMQRMPL